MVSLQQQVVRMYLPKRGFLSPYYIGAIHLRATCEIANRGTARRYYIFTPMEACYNSFFGAQFSHTLPTIVGFSSCVSRIHNANNPKKLCQYSQYSYYSKTLNVILKAFLRFLGSETKYYNISPVQNPK